MLTLTLKELCAVTGGHWQGEEALLERRPAFLTSDSRQAGEGCLFAALRGERTDGHKYIGEVLQRGAMAVLCEEPGAAGEPRLVVDDVMEALAKAGSECRRRSAIPYVGITGSVGKTTAKEMVAAALSGRYRVFKTPGNLNGQLGVPMSLLNMGEGHEAAVIEMGISQFGEMRRLSHIVRPHIAVFTNIGQAHLEFLRDRDGVLEAKGEIREGMDDHGLVICNGDDDKLREKDFGCRTLRFGLDPSLDFYAENIRVAADGRSQRCDVVYAGGRFSLEIPAYGEYMVYAALAAAAVALSLGLSEEELCRGIRSYEPVGHRSRVLDTPLFTLVDDCYNANPDSARAAVRSLRHFPSRRVCILGDMLEMGPESGELHRELGRYAVEQGAGLVLSAGSFAGDVAAGAGERGRAFADKAELIRSLPALLKKGDAVLVKASRGCRYEEIVSAVEEMQEL